MNLEIDDDVPFVRLFGALAKIGLITTRLPGGEFSFRVSTRPGAAPEAEAPGRGGMKYLRLVEPRHIVLPESPGET